MAMAINIKAVINAFREAGIPVTGNFQDLSMRQVAVVNEQAQLRGYRRPTKEILPTALCFFRHVQRLATAPVSSGRDRAQAEAIAEADAHLQNAGLTTYRDLTKALADVLAYEDDRPAEGTHGAEVYARAEAALAAARAIATQCPHCFRDLDPDQLQAGVCDSDDCLRHDDAQNRAA